MQHQEQQPQPMPQPELPVGSLPDYAPATTTPEPVTRMRLGSRIAAATMAGVAGTVLGILPAEAEAPDKNEPLTAAQEVVRPAGTRQYEGVRQAEKFFDEPVLERSRQAFDSFLKGDKDALRQQKEANGYQSNWIEKADIAKVEQATSFDELESAFKIPFEKAGAPVFLSLLRDKKTAESLKELTGETHEPIADLEATKKMAKEIIGVWNLFDKRAVSDMQPLQFTLVDTLPNGLQGYYREPLGDEKADQIVMEVTEQEKDIDPHMYTVPAHEVTHYLELNGQTNKRYGEDKDISNFDGMQANGVFSRKITWLNPDGYQYRYRMSKTHDGEFVVTAFYGNTNEREDAGTSGIAFEQKPELHLEHSARSEKQAAIIFEFEKQFPGFTASMLERATIAPSEVPGKPPLLMDQMRSEPASLMDKIQLIANKAVLPLSGVGVGLVLGIAAAMAYRKRRQ